VSVVLAVELADDERTRGREPMSVSPTTEPIIAVELNLPGELVRRIDALAAQSGTDRSTVVTELLRGKLPTALAAVLAPVHEDFRKSGMTEADLDTLLESELEAHRRGQ
jgi:hypothetical protein